MANLKLRNIALIAHIDHGKTTLVDCLLRQGGIFRPRQEVADRILDSQDLERERGITILSKNTAINYQDLKINIVDTPGHTDFGGEVERVLEMVDGALLLVDAFEGPMAQTKFVLKKALEKNLRIIVVINKIDRPDARPHEVMEEIFDLFVELNATEWQLDFPLIYTDARRGTASLEPDRQGEDLKPLLDLIAREIPSPEKNSNGILQLQINTLDYSEHLGRIGIGRIRGGTIKEGQTVALCKPEGSPICYQVANLWDFNGLKRQKITGAGPGEIVALTGPDNLNIGDTIANPDHPYPLPAPLIDEPTLHMTFMVNDSPFAGQEGQFVTPSQLQKRLLREAETNVSLKVSPGTTPEAFEIAGRGELHLGILIENLRREGFELQVSRPRPIIKTINGVTCEPFERLFILLPEKFTGRIIEAVGQRGGELTNMEATENIGSFRLEFLIPARGLIGFRSEMLTESRGEAVMHHLFEEYAPCKEMLPPRRRGALIAFKTGEATPFGLYNSSSRGTFFIGPTERVYAGMVIGENSREEDLEINVGKKKNLTNHRASGAEETLRLPPPRKLTLEEALVFIADDELVEVTPKNIRLRKRILDHNQRRRKK